MALSVIENPPKKFFTQHLWADWVEIACLTSLDRRIEVQTVVSLYGQSHDGIVGTEDSEAEESITADDSSTTAEVDDIVHTRVQEWFSHLKMRANHLREVYPFTIADGGAAIEITDILTPSQQVYVALLLMANLRFVSKSQQIKLAAVFELACVIAFEEMLPTRAEVHHAGKNPISEGRYTGNEWARLNALASDLYETIKVDEEDFAPTSSGDNGVDIIGWIPMGDIAPGRPLFFAQCACTDEWVSKKWSSCGPRWERHINLQSVPVNIVFVPFCMRKANAVWFQPGEIGPDVFIDRFRLLHLLSDKMQDVLALTSWPNVTTYFEN